jgi:aminomethyltransferase
MNNPAADPYAGERLLESPFHPRQAPMNLRDAWSSWNGYKFADYYYDAEYEYFCVRNTCGTYDICPMQKYHISGPDALAALNRMVTRDVSTLREGRVTYVCWCTDDGRLVDDGTIFRLGPEKYMLTCGSPSLAWLRKALFGFPGVDVRDVTGETAALSLQGPTSCAVLKQMGLADIELLRPFGFAEYPWGEGRLMVSRTGFTGDLGYELWTTPGRAIELWDALYAAGENHGIHPFGEAATNMARLEAGFIMPDMEFNEALKTVHFEHDHTPLELNLGWLVDFKKPHFNGRTALLEEKARGPRHTLTRLDIEGNKPAGGAWLYGDRKCAGEHMGYVTSAMWSPAAKANIALAMIETRRLGGEIWAEIYYEKELRHYRKVARCSVADKPFWAPPRGCRGGNSRQIPQPSACRPAL